MSESEQIEHFSDELDKLVERFRVEYDLHYASVVGALAMKQHLLMTELTVKEEPPNEGPS